jgi:long-chain acyl-CoA synthetase
MTGVGLWNIVRTQPQLRAVVEPDGREISFGELAAAADRYGRGLQAMGLRPGDSLVMMLPNGADLVSVFFAGLQAGLYIVVVNWNLLPRSIDYLDELPGDPNGKLYKRRLSEPYRVGHERAA